MDACDGEGRGLTATLFGVVWGVLICSPIALRAHRRVAGARASILASEVGHMRRSTKPWKSLGPIGAVLGRLSRARSERWALRIQIRELPLVLDLLALAVSAGCTPYRSLEIAIQWGPDQCAVAFRRVLGATAIGARLSDALGHMEHDAPALAPVADVLIASEQLGAPAAQTLARLADEARADLRRRAEARARVLPVKLLFPLVFLVLPAFGLLTVVPALISALDHL